MKTTTKAPLLAATALIASAGLLAGWTGADTSGETRAVQTQAREGTPYTVEAVHSSVVFKIRHVGATNFYGRFNQFSGAVEFDEEAGELVSVSFEIPLESVDSNNERRDGHIKSADFFNVGQYPTATFESTGYTSTGEGAGTLKGNLTFHGVTKAIEAKVMDIGTGDQGGTAKMGFEARFSFKRTDFGITTYVADDGGEGGPLGNTVHLIVAVEAAKD